MSHCLPCVVYVFVCLFIYLFCSTTGLYTKTLARIVYRDISRFTCVFLVVFLAFCGAFFLSLRAASAVQIFGLSVLVYRAFLCLYKSLWREIRFTNCSCTFVKNIKIVLKRFLSFINQSQNIIHEATQGVLNVGSSCQML